MTGLRDLQVFMESNSQYAAMAAASMAANAASTSQGDENSKASFSSSSVNSKPSLLGYHSIMETPGVNLHHHPHHPMMHQQEALIRERQSLMFLQQLVGHSLQVLGDKNCTFSSKVES